MGPSHTLPQLQQFLDPQDKLYLPKGQTEMARHAGKASRRTEHLTVICLTKFYRLLCLTPGYGRNTGKREGWEWKQRGVLKTSKTRWDWDVFLALAGDVLQGQSAQPGTQGRGRPVWGEPCSTAGQPHLSKDVTMNVAVTVPGVRLKRSLCGGSDSGVEEGMLNTVADKLYMQVSLTLSTLILNL